MGPASAATAGGFLLTALSNARQSTMLVRSFSESAHDDLLVRRSVHRDRIPSAQVSLWLTGLTPRVHAKGVAPSRAQKQTSPSPYFGKSHPLSRREPRRRGQGFLESDRLLAAADVTLVATSACGSGWMHGVCAGAVGCGRAGTAVLGV